MIKFFRKTRKQLLTENKFSKYLLYAIGEIILVVIGILIALQINNQNNIKQERKTEKVYLLALQEEFKTNKKKLNDVIDLNNKIIDGVGNLTRLFQNKTIDTTSEKTVVTLLYQTFAREIYYTPSSGVLTEIISSGNLKLIQNQKLKQKLASFGGSLGLIRHQEEEVEIHRLKIQDNFRDQGNYKRFLTILGRDFEWESIFENTSNKKLFTSLSFLNNLFFFQETSNVANSSFYIPLREDMEITLGLINSELNKK